MTTCRDRLGSIVRLHPSIADSTPSVNAMDPPFQPLGQLLRDRVTTPPHIGSKSDGPKQNVSGRPGINLLTPPASPNQSRNPSNQYDDQDNSEQNFSDVDSIRSSLPKPAANDATICPFDVKVLTDQRGGNHVFGHGAWSTVFKAVRQQAPSSLGVFTPPSSPVAASPLLLAVKVPTRKDAALIMEREARILTYMSRIPESEKYVVHFYGMVPAYSSLVLTAIPLSLEDQLITSAKNARTALSTWNMSNPVIGTERSWLGFAHKVISALNWLHEVGVVHGDIKPGNIMLTHSSKSANESFFPFDPIFIDFSSSHLPHSGSACTNSLSAVTREYTAPELLSVSVLRDPNATATFDSDVFSTAVTLLVAATGDTKVYSGSIFQRQAMATQGWQVIQFARSGDNGSRVPRQGIVERTLERAVLRAGMGRVTASQWLRIVNDMMSGEPSKAS
jgi:hypothetical protein